MTSPVIVLDLRSGAGDLAGAAGLRDAVTGRLREAGRPEPADEHYRFLLIDTPAGLGVRHGVYERVIGYGKRTSVLALVVGELASADEPVAPGRGAPGGSWDPLAAPGSSGAWGDTWGSGVAGAGASGFDGGWGSGSSGFNGGWGSGSAAPGPDRPAHHGP
ncbi:MAG TPA: hypothetical protein VIU15_09130, partial [Streptomyces sp.]